MLELNEEEIKAVLDFIQKLNRASRESGVTIDPSYGGLDYKGKNVGRLGLLADNGFASYTVKDPS